MEIPTEHAHALNIDSRLNQKREQTNPVEKNRRPNDVCFIPAFLALLAIWLVLSSLGMFSPEKPELDDTLSYIQTFINAPVTKFSALLPVSLLQAMAVICFCLFLYEKLTNGCIYISAIIIIFGMISSLSSFLIPVYSSRKTKVSIINLIRLIVEKQPVGAVLTLTYYLIYVLPYSINVVTSVVSFFNVDIRILRHITRDSFQLIQSSPPLLLFTSLISILGFLVLSFTFNALLTNPRTLHLFDYVSFITIVGGICALEFIINFARMVISEYTINSFYMKGEKVPIGPIIMKSLRNHTGTAMLASTVFVSLICSIIEAVKHKPTWRIKGNYIFYIVTKVALVTAPDTALIFSAIHGTGFQASYQKTFDAVLRRSKIYMAMQLVIYGVFVMISFGLIIPIAVMIGVGINISDGPSEDIIKNTSIVFYGFFYTTFVYGLLILSTMKAHLINKIVILNNEDHGTEEKTNMLNRF